MVIERVASRLRSADSEDFYRLSWSLVYRLLAATLGDADLACESVDEAMARAFARWDTVQKEGNPEGWVYRVAYRWVLDRLRRRGRLRLLLPRLGTPDHGDEHMVEPGLEAARHRHQRHPLQGARGPSGPARDPQICSENTHFANHSVSALRCSAGRLPTVSGRSVTLTEVITVVCRRRGGAGPCGLEQFLGRRRSRR